MRPHEASPPVFAERLGQHQQAPASATAADLDVGEAFDQRAPYVGGRPPPINSDNGTAGTAPPPTAVFVFKVSEIQKARPARGAKQLPPPVEPEEARPTVRFVGDLPPIDELDRRIADLREALAKKWVRGRAAKQDELVTLEVQRELAQLGVEDLTREFEQICNELDKRAIRSELACGGWRRWAPQFGTTERREWEADRAFEEQRFGAHRKGWLKGTAYPGLTTRQLEARLDFVHRLLGNVRSEDAVPEPEVSTTCVSMEEPRAAIPEGVARRSGEPRHRCASSRPIRGLGQTAKHEREADDLIWSSRHEGGDLIMSSTQDFFGRILERLRNVRGPDPSGNYTAVCPFHDENPSLSVHPLRGFNCFGCGEKGSIRSLARRLGIEVPQAGLTLGELAKAKDLTQEFLEGLGVANITYCGRPAVRIPYVDEEGQELAVRFRLALDGERRFTWRRGDKPMPYGLSRLKEARENNVVVLVEGESDCWALWREGIPALGILGASTWRSEWAAYVKDIDRLYVWREPDADGDALIERIARDLPTARVVVPPEGIKHASDLYLSSRDFREEINQLLSLAEPLSSGTEERTAGELLQVAAPLLEDPGLLHRVARELEVRGLAGERRNALILYLAMSSRFFRQPINVLVAGPPAAGKNFLVDTVKSLLPADAVYEVTTTSERALAYTDEELRNRVLIFQEAAGMHHDGVGAAIIRSLVWGGRVVLETVSTSGGLRPLRIEKEGPTAFVATSTRPLEPELETRILTINVADDPVQTRSILLALARSSNEPLPPEAEALIALQRWLGLAGTNEVSVPFAEWLAERMPVGSVRVRRDFQHLLTAIRTSAFLHQRQRPQDANGRIVATVADYAIVSLLFGDAFRGAMSGGLTTAQREAVETVRSLSVANNGVVSYSAVAKALGIDESSAHRRLRAPLKLGYVVNDETREFHPARLRPGDPLPDEAPPLPAADELREAFPGLADPWVDPLTGEWHGQGEGASLPANGSASVQAPSPPSHAVRALAGDRFDRCRKTRGLAGLQARTWGEPTPSPDDADRPDEETSRLETDGEWKRQEQLEEDQEGDWEISWTLPPSSGTATPPRARGHNGVSRWFLSS